MKGSINHFSRHFETVASKENQIANVREQAKNAAKTT
jgi:hypothetical protein